MDSFIKASDNKLSITKKDIDGLKDKDHSKVSIKDFSNVTFYSNNNIKKFFLHEHKKRIIKK